MDFKIIRNYLAHLLNQSYPHLHFSRKKVPTEGVGEEILNEINIKSHTLKSYLHLSIVIATNFQQLVLT